MLLKLFAFQFVVEAILCYTAVLERTERVLLNDDYVEDVSVYIKRHSRQSPYFLNIEGRTKHTWNNNVTIVIELKEKRSNRYHPSFMNFSFGLCNMVSKDFMFGTMLRQVGLLCPLPPAYHTLHNLTIHLEKFPSVMPLEKGRAHVGAMLTETKEIFVQYYIYFTITDSKKAAKKPKAIGPGH